MKKIFIMFGFMFFIPVAVMAHCPLCTVGAGILVVFATWLGVGTTAIGVLVGATALYMGMWVANMVKRNYIRKQRHAITALVFVGTVLPLLPLTVDFGSVYVSFFGEYGTMFNKTYVYSKLLVGSIIGAVVVMSAPFVHSTLLHLFGKKIRFQNLIITLTLVAIVAAITELL